jgi:hypothetical protein
MATNVILSVSEESLARREAPSVSGGASAPPDKKARSLRTAGERSFAVGSFAPSAQDDKQCHSERKRRISQEAGQRPAECERRGIRPAGQKGVLRDSAKPSLLKRWCVSSCTWIPNPGAAWRLRRQKRARCLRTALWTTHCAVLAHRW